MLAIAIIVFRETLEAALIVGIVLAASVGIISRGRFVAGGIAAGIAGAALVAGFAASIADAFEGNGQELLNAAVLCLAVCMLGWHNIWMATHAREMAAEAGRVGRQVAAGSRPLTALAIIVGAAVLREGSETVLFIFGILAGSHEGAISLLAGGALGLAGGIAAGGAIYAGLLRIPLHRLFVVTSWMVLLLAAGLAAQAAAFLVQADLLPALGNQVWDTSAVLSDDSIPGRVLHTLVGYVARPEGIQLVAFAATLLAIGLPMRLITRQRAVVVAVALAVAATLAGAVLAPRPAHAELKVRQPQVDYLEFELEHNGLVTFGAKGSGLDHAQSYTNEIEYGVTPWWMTGLEGELEVAGGGGHLMWNAVTWENLFQLTETGKYWANIGFFAEYSRGTLRGEPDSFLAGPIVQKELNNVFGVDTRHTLNVFFAHDVGRFSGRGTALEIGWQSVALLHPLFAPGFEYYAAIDDVGRAGPTRDQTHYIGPVVTGLLRLDRFGKLKYEAGYLFGLTPASGNGAVRWRLEYEVVF